MSETLTTERIEDFAALREVEEAWLAEHLSDAIASLGYPVGCGIAPHPETMAKAARNLFNHYAMMVELARSAADAELLALRKRVEWQDISTAPKDGTVFLGYEPHNAVSEMRWEAYDPDDAYDVGDEGYWSYTVAVMCDTLEPPEPTHWQPLPASPLPTPKEPS